VSLVAPEAAVIKVLTYEDRFNIPAEKQSGNIVICVGDANGSELGVLARANIVKSLKSRIPLGNSLSLISPEVTPVESTISCEYDDETFNGGLDLYASQINEIITNTISPESLPLGEEVNYQEVFNTIYSLSFVDKIKTLAFKKLINQPQGTDQFDYCSDLFVSELINDVCIESSEAYIDSVNTTYKNTNPIRTYRSYRVVVSLVAASTQAPLTYTFINKDYDSALRG
jgi:hypothetical protein